MKYAGWPEPGELVVGKVDDVEDFGVFIDLEEYEDKRGLVHISEVASGWIKNVRDHVREDQTVVAKVLDVDEEAQQIDLSLKDVNDHQRSETIQAWKNEQKADAWMELALEDAVDDERFVAIAEELLAGYGSLYDAFEEAAIHGGDTLDDLDIEDDEGARIVETARENVAVPYVEVTGYVDLRSPDSAGVDDVKAALRSAGDQADDEVELEVTYVGAPEYRIRVRAPDYKRAEEALEESAERAREALEAAGGTAAFHRRRRAEAD
ncbi:MAG: translation initiation factor IF-2 subunit alpha [Halobacteriales archaeon]